MIYVLDADAYVPVSESVCQHWRNQNAEQGEDQLCLKMKDDCLGDLFEVQKSCAMLTLLIKTVNVH